MDDSRNEPYLIVSPPSCGGWPFLVDRIIKEIEEGRHVVIFADDPECYVPTPIRASASLIKVPLGGGHTEWHQTLDGLRDHEDGTVFAIDSWLMPQEIRNALLSTHQGAIYLHAWSLSDHRKLGLPRDFELIALAFVNSDRSTMSEMNLNVPERWVGPRVWSWSMSGGIRRYLRVKVRAGLAQEMEEAAIRYSEVVRRWTMPPLIQESNE